MFFRASAGEFDCCWIHWDRRGSLYVSAKLPTYPSPRPTFCPKGDVSVNVGLGEGYVGSFQETYNDPPIPGVQIVECGEKS